MNDRSLERLVADAKASNLDAFGELMRRFERMVFGYSYALLGNSHDAEDATQESFFEAYREIRQLQSPAAFAGWLRRIVVKHCDRQMRKKPVAVPEGTAAVKSSQDFDPLDLAQSSEIKARIHKAIASLPKNERAVVNLFYIEGHSQNDVAEFLETPISTINNWLASGRKLLKERLSDMAEDLVKSSLPLPEDIGERVKFLLGMAERLEGGESCYQALVNLEKTTQVAWLKQAIGDMAASLKKGARLSAAFNKHPKLYPPEVIWIIETGERLRVLDIALRIALEWVKTGGRPESTAN